MFVANVLVGRYTKGDSSMARPPPLPSYLQSTNKQHDLYDSTVDNESQPTIYVVYEMEKCYPAYLIMYKSTNDFVKWKTYRNRNSSFEPDPEFPLKPTPATRMNLPPRVSPATQSHGASSSSISSSSSASRAGVSPSNAAGRSSSSHSTRSVPSTASLTGVSSSQGAGPSSTPYSTRSVPSSSTYHGMSAGNTMPSPGYPRSPPPRNKESDCIIL